MIEITTKIRKWGNSFGIVIPHSKVEKDSIKEGNEVNVLINKNENILKETFGTFKFKKSTQKMIDEIDKELSND